MKPTKAWAIYENGKLAVYDYRLPIMWDKKIALKEMKEVSGNNGTLVKVEIRPIKKTKRD